MTASIPDSDVRSEIASSTDESFVVSAGAGTGKTELLVRRIYSVLVQGGVQPEELVAITFTEAAASELRERVRRRLLERLRDTADSEAERGRISYVLSHLDAARISTIHSFAQSILSEFSVQAGIPVGFQVVDPAVYRSELSARSRDFVAEICTDPDVASLFTVLSALGYELRRELPRLTELFMDRTPHLRVPRRLSGLDLAAGDEPGDMWRLSEAIRGSKKARLVPDLSAMLEDSDIFEAAEELRRLEILDALPVDAKGLAERSLFLVERLRNWVDDQANAGLYAATTDLGLLHSVSTKATSKRFRKSLPSDFIDMEDKIRDESERVLRSLKESCAMSVLAILARFSFEEAERRRRSGELTFTDLLTIALELLETRAEIRKRISERYKCLFIDEFQDTDPLQVLLGFSILDLCHPALADSGDGGCALSHDDHNSDPPDGRLVVVGDVKQSIYGFRGARPAVLAGLEKRWVDRTRRLDSNFRSRHEILAFVNSVFENAFSRTEDGLAVAYDPLRPARIYNQDVSDDSASPPRVVIIGERVDALAEEVRRAEIRHVAALIAEAVGSDGGRGWVVEKSLPGAGAELRKPSFSDIAVLIRARTWLPQLEEVFTETGIPYRLETGGLLYATQEAADIKAVLRAIDDPTDSIGVVAALKTSIFSCSDQDLYDYFKSNGRREECWRYSESPSRESPALSARSEACESGDTSGPDYVASCLSILRDLYDQQHRMSPADLLERLIRRQMIFEGALMERYRERWRRYRLLVDDCRRFFESPTATIKEFLQWMHLMQDEDSPGADSICPEPDDDSVRVLTIHGAKGLEFPIVFAVGAIDGRRSSGSDPVIVASDGSVEIQLGRKELGIRTPGYEDSRTKRAAEEVAEEIRLAYVAFTRARDYLVVSRYGQKSEKSTKDGNSPVRAEIEALVGSAVGASDPPSAEEKETSREIELDWGKLRIEPRIDSAEASKQTSESEVRAAVAQPIFKGADAKPVRSDLILQNLAGVADGLALRLPVFSASEIAGALAPYDFTRQRKESPRWSETHRDPLEFGKAVHEVLAEIDLSTANSGLGADISEVVSGMLRALDYDDVDDQAVAEVIERAFKLRVVADAASNPHWKELYMCAPGPGGTAIEGYADLVIKTKDGFVIADYKTDSLSSAADSDELVRHYSYQLAAYAYALGKAVGEPVHRCVLLFLGDAEPKEVEVSDLPVKLDEISKFLEETAAMRTEAMAGSGIVVAGSST